MAQHQLTLVQKEGIWGKAIEEAAAKFAESSLDFSQEQIFATEQLLKNNFLLDVAVNNPASLKLALHNVSAIGLTLNPQSGLAYLVPRRVKSSEPYRVMLDISYMGLISIGVETGSILCAKSELVYTGDSDFQYRGPFEAPLHRFDPFLDEKQRGDLRGGYCQAMLPSGAYMVQVMSVFDMHKIRDKSEAYKKGCGPWIDWADQMYLKCPVKRGSKWWPKKSPRMATALKVLNEDNGEGIAILEHTHANTALPAPPPAEDISEITRAKVQKFVNRAVKANAWAACKDLMENRIVDPVELSYALNQLSVAQSTAQQSRATTVN